MRRLVVSVALALPLAALALPVKSGENFRVQIPGEYIVKSFGEKMNLPVKRKLGKNLFLVKASSQKSLNGFAAVYPNYAYYGEYKDVVSSDTPNDQSFNDQFHHEMIQTTKAWETTKGDKEIIIAVTDNEFQLDHVDMQTTWYKNPNEIADNGIDDDNNGYIDDVYGYDFMGEDNDVDATDVSTHGTHVAGTIAATANNKLGGAGIAPKLKVMPLRWYGNERTWTSAIVAETYRYAVDNGAKIITTSYNIDYMVDDQAYLDSVAYIRANDVLLFNSAGNGYRANPPRQKIEEIILVCAVKSSDASNADEKAGFSNWGTGIDICAPGNPVYAPVQADSGVQNAYGNLSGTSMATPQAAAVAGLIWSAHPNFSDEEVRDRLLNSADDIEAKNPRYQGMLGAGRINAFKAVK
ncbi:MAG: hypothetical protein CME62_08965 [Halobacteriovoraceae bacterium]|nr:hypothetical protein [Halobacteriovoraceae bacterium]|tara:strand:- start:2216 stop:3442 length:1227 start_codon:yes stop_codon:yes gene_type:complete